MEKIVKHRNALMLEVDALRQQVAGVEVIEKETNEDIERVFKEANNG